MKVVCDNCRAVYRVPDAKLTKAVNKATCRNCGHRMLIPRPKPGADPEERTLVTAVPPTPAGAPPRVDDHRMGGHTRPITEDDNESTLPGRQPDDLHMGTPSPADRRADDFDGPSTVVSDMPPGMPASSYPPDPSQNTTLVQAPAGRQPPARSGPSSQAPRRTPMPAAPRRTPGPAPRRNTPLYTAGQVYDPSSDLNWALFGTAGALLGAFLLAFLSVYNHALLMWFGLAFAFGGSVLTFLVLLTGGRGRHPAKTPLSVVSGFIVAVFMSTTMVATKVGAEVAIDALDINFAAPPPGGGAAEPAMPDAGRPVPVPVPGTPEPDPKDGVVEAPQPAPAQPSPEPTPKNPRPSPQPGPAPRPQPTPSPQPQPMPAPAPPPSGGPGDMKTVPAEVIHVMLSNNLEVKKCFVPMFKAGTLPPRVDVSFTILPAGNATKIAVKSPPTLRGSELERCLQSAVARIAFPPTTGQGTSTTYPFVLK